MVLELLALAGSLEACWLEERGTAGEGTDRGVEVEEAGCCWED